MSERVGAETGDRPGAETGWCLNGLLPTGRLSLGSATNEHETAHTILLMVADVSNFMIYAG